MTHRKGEGLPASADVTGAEEKPFPFEAVMDAEKTLTIIFPGVVTASGLQDLLSYLHSIPDKLKEAHFVRVEFRDRIGFDEAIMFALATASFSSTYRIATIVNQPKVEQRDKNIL